jgi:outer membrane biosynthesis protein TonB
MFRAVTKERVASGPGKDAPGTLTNLWKKSQVKQDTDEAMEEIDLIEEPAEAMPMQADEPMPQQANNVEVEVTPDAPLTVEAGPSDAPKMVDEPIPAPEEEQTGPAPSNVVDAVVSPARAIFPFNR